VAMPVAGIKDLPVCWLAKHAAGSACSPSIRSCLGGGERKKSRREQDWEALVSFHLLVSKNDAARQARRPVPLVMALAFCWRTGGVFRGIRVGLNL